MAAERVMMFLLLAAPLQLEASAANPVRKAVTMLQNMQASVTAEGKKEQALHEKYQCYCKNGRGDLETSISDAENKIANLDAATKAASEKKVQTASDLAQHTTDRADAKTAIKKATALRNKEAGEYAKESSDLKQNLAALAKATSAIEKGSTAFVQTSAAAVVRTIAMEKADISDESRQVLLAFLSGAVPQDGYVPQSGQILGILKTMHDEMSVSLADATQAEQEAIQTYEALMAAKRKEIEALSAQIEVETQRVGELSVEIASMSNDNEDTAQALAEDKKFLAGLSSGCDQKAADWEVVKATRAEELIALSETIKVLNDDDSLELFKKALPSASASFVEIQASMTVRRAKALEMLRAVKSPQLDFIEMAINGKKVGFEKVVKLIDELVANLKVDQTDDDNKKNLLRQRV